jgi:hypothetical protein
VCFKVIAGHQQSSQQQTTDQQGHQNHLRALHHTGRSLLHVDLLRETHSRGNGGRHHDQRTQYGAQYM